MNIEHSTFNIERRIKEILNTEKGKWRAWPALQNQSGTTLWPMGLPEKSPVSILYFNHNICV